MRKLRTEETYDVVIVGGGPSGTASARLLAEKGWKVVVLEKEEFPRYKIGESLIPWCWYPMERLGLNEKMEEQDFVVAKHSVQFVGLDGQRSTPFYFFKHTDHPCAKTWQVVRSEFDVLLRDHAVEAGASFYEGTTVRELIREEDQVVGVVAERNGERFEVRGKMTIDASGRDMFSVTRNGWRVPDAKLKKIAIWTYYKGAMRECGLDEGATTVAYLPEKGWFWYIPLSDDMVSVGVVAERDYLYRGERDPDAIFEREVELQPWIKRHLSEGEKTRDCRVTGDYSYRSQHCASDGLLLVGDAFAFLDPVFSSGVFLALQTGVLAADAVHDALAADDVGAERFVEYGDRVCQGIEAMRRLVYAFYDETFSFGTFLKKYPNYRQDMTDCLIGHLEKDYDPMFEAVKEFAEIPDALSHGRPLIVRGVEQV